MGAMRIPAAALFAVMMAATAVGEPFRSRRSPGETIKSYDIVHPHIVYEDGSRPYPKTLMLAVYRGGANFTLKLVMNEQLLPPHFSARHYRPGGEEVLTKGITNCCYHGNVVGKPKWSLTAYTCHGLRASFGVYGDRNQFYHLEPLVHNTPSFEDAHVMYEDSELSNSEGICGSDHSIPHIPGFQAKLNDTAKPRERRQMGSFLFLELGIINDHAQFLRHGSDLEATQSRSCEIANTMDNLYRQLGISIALVTVITWNQGDRIIPSTDPNTLLDRYQDYVGITSFHSDASLLLTGQDLLGNTVGIAFLNSVCDDRASVGVVQDGGRNLASVGVTAAHELGHLLNMRHDDSSTCSCPDDTGKCIMASFSSELSYKWSQCSRNELGNYSCLYNIPLSTVKGQRCGDGILEGDEVCDCGGASTCSDPCCNANTCRLSTGSQCSPSNGGTCCTPSCQFRSYGTTCRAAGGACDLTEYCSGSSAQCPTDLHAQNGISCSNGQAYCFSGQCRTQAEQCRKNFGDSAVPGYGECFRYNTRGDIYGNCGYSTTSFLPCQTSDTQCGMLFCTGGSYQANVNTAVTIVSLRVYLTATRSIGQCQAFTPNPTDFVSPGLTHDGTKCGEGKVCYEQRCRALSEISGQACPTGSNSFPCSGNGQCSSTGVCVCSIGFTGVTCATGTGSDINECSSGNGGCDHICTNTPGSFECTCRSGYQLDSNGRSCNDINECTAGTSGCSQNCINFDGSFACSCRSGYQLASDGKSCNDINECNTGTSGCNQNCINFGGSFACSCINGYQLASDGKSCNDINECSTGASGCSQNCFNFGGSFACSCRSGYQLASDRKSCNDINECNTGTSGCSQNCINLVGSFVCSCRSGYQLASDGRNCNDINECAAETSGCSQNCANLPGSFQCSCRGGYQLISNGRSCNDINECVAGTSGCSQNCANSPGSFECSCRSGYQLASNRRSCNDINECVTGTSGCSHNCANSPGSFQCSCRSGHQLASDGKGCNDINECNSGNGGCSHICTNTQGSYGCSCRSGFVLGTDQKSCNLSISTTPTTLLPTTPPSPTQPLTTLPSTTQGSYGCSRRSGFDLGTDQKSCNPSISTTPTTPPPTTPPSTTPPPTTPPSTTQPLTTPPSTTQPPTLNPSCGLRTAVTGSVESTGWPERYNSNDDCDWVISLPDNSMRVHIKFSSPYGLAGNPPCTRDYVEFFDIAGTTETSLGRFCGCCTTPAPLTASGSVVRVVFHSGSRHGGRRRGFHIKYNSV